ncbi:MAG: DoxX family protein [bacterium]
MQKYATLLSRLLISMIFIMSGLGKIFDPASSMGYMKSVGMPAVGFFLIMAVILEVAGGISVLIGYKAKWGAMALIVFLIPVTLIFHTNFSNQIQMIMFMKNLAILGALIGLAINGPGAMSLDTREAAPVS